MTKRTKSSILAALTVASALSAAAPAMADFSLASCSDPVVASKNLIRCQLFIGG